MVDLPKTREHSRTRLERPQSYQKKETAEAILADMDFGLATGVATRTRAIPGLSGLTKLLRSLLLKGSTILPMMTTIPKTSKKITSPVVTQTVTTSKTSLSTKMMPTTMYLLPILPHCLTQLAKPVEKSRDRLH